MADDEVIITPQVEEHLTSVGYEVAGKANSGESAIKAAVEGALYKKDLEKGLNKPDE